MKIRYCRIYEIDIDDDTLVDCCKARSIDRDFDEAGIQDILYELDQRGLLTEEDGEVDLPELVDGWNDFESDFYTPEQLRAELSN